MQKRFSENFGLLASYEWSHAYGTSNDNWSGVHDIPEQRQYEIGVLDFDIPSTLKIQGSYDQPDLWTIGKTHGGFDVGWSFDAESGSIYRPVVWNNYYFGYYNLNSPSDGRYRLPMFSQTDVQLDLNLAYGDAIEWSVGLNCYNIFNERTITSVDDQYGPDGSGVDSNVWENPYGYQSPRKFELVLRGDF